MDDTRAPGDIVGERYRVVSVLGQGGAGITYECEELATGTRVALKQLRLWHGQDWKVLELFQREAAVLSRLDHPAIPRYRDSFEIDTPSGRSFFQVQDLAPGRSLAEWVKSGWHATEADARDIAARVLAILSYLHGLAPAVIHRDVKPENIVRAEDGRVFLVDFGAVRAVYRSTFTDASTVVGTFGYMAPEQLRAQAVPSSDLYGLGATLLVLLTHRPPAELPTRKGRFVVRGVANVSLPFARFIEKLLAPDPDDRPATAAIARALLDRLPSPAAARLRQGLAATLAAGTIVAVAAAGIIAWRARAHTAAVAPPPPPPVVVPAAPPSSTLALVTTLTGHWSAVFSIAFSPDGASLASASWDQTIKLWNVATSSTVRSFAGHTGHAVAVAFTPDGRTLLSGGDTTVRVWTVDGSAPTRVLAGHTGRVTSVASTSDGKTIVSGSEDGTIRVWALATGETLRSFHEGTGRVFSVAVGPDDKLVASGGQDGVVRIWELATGKLVESKTGHAGAVDRVVFAPDGRTLVSTSDDRTAKVWVLGQDKPMRTLSAHTDEVWAAAIAPDGKTLATGGKDGSIKVWDIYTGELRAGVTVSPRGVLSLAFAPDGRTLASGDGANLVRVWSFAKPSWRPPRVTEPIPAPAATPPANDAPSLTRAAKDLLDGPAGGTKGVREAHGYLDRAVALDPNYALAYVGLGRIEYKSGYISHEDYRADALVRAHAMFDKALAMSPGLLEAFVGKGYAFSFQKDLAGAHRMIDEAERAHPGSPETKLLAMDIAMSEKRYDDAFAAARALIEGTQDARLRGAAYSHLSTIYKKRGEWDAADEAYASLVNLSPGGAWEKGNYAVFLTFRHEHDRAIAMAKAALADFDYPMGHRILADAYAAKGLDALAADVSGKEARPLFDLALAQDPGCADAHYGRATLLQTEASSHGNPDLLADAKRELRLALARDPKHSGALAALARIAAL